MAKAKRVRVHATEERYGVRFRCPGCDDEHTVPAAPSPGGWRFNEDYESPTLEPSILVYPHGLLLEDGVTRGETPRCHSFVAGGRISYCSDSTHALAGRTVDLPDLPP